MLNYRLRSQFLTILSFFDRLRFKRHLSLVMERDHSWLLSINDKKIRYLIFKKFSFSYPNVSKVVLNLSSVEFSHLELTILAHGLDHCIPSSIVKHKEIYSKFEVLFAQLWRLQPVSTDLVSDLKARLNDLAHTYAGTPVSSWEYIPPPAPVLDYSSKYNPSGSQPSLNDTNYGTPLPQPCLPPSNLSATARKNR